MKPSNNPILHLNAHVIRHNLSQPEEIDQVLMAMAAEDRPTNAPIAGGAKSVETVRDPERIAISIPAGSSYGFVHMKSVPHMPDHYLFFAPRNA